MKELLAKIAAPATENGNLSIGRTMMIICFGIAVYKWITGSEIPDTQLTVLMTLIGYILGTKVLASVKDMIGNVKETKNSIKESK